MRVSQTAVQGIFITEFIISFIHSFVCRAKSFPPQISIKLNKHFIWTDWNFSWIFGMGLLDFLLSWGMSERMQWIWCSLLPHRVCLLLNFQLLPTHPSNHYYLFNSPAACQRLKWNEILAKENTWKSHSMNRCIQFSINYVFKYVCWLIQKIYIHIYTLYIYVHDDFDCEYV